MAENKGKILEDFRKSLPEALKALIDRVYMGSEYYSKIAKVVSVDVSEKTCEVSFFDDEANNDQVAIEQTAQTGGFFFKPSVDSVVVISYIDENNAFISLYSEIDEVLFQGGVNDGLVKVNDLVTKLNNLENDLNTLKTAFASWVVVPSDGGAALKTITSTWYGSALTPTVKTDLENKKFKH